MQAKEIEQSLWKTGFYAVIEEFRKRIKQAKDAGPPAEENLRKVRYGADILATVKSIA